MIGPFLAVLELMLAAGFVLTDDKGESDMLSPIKAGKYFISQRFGNRDVPKGAPYSSHNGLDFAAPSGTPIMAAADGKVLRADMDSEGFGLHVRIQHPDGSLTLYGHMSEIQAQAGQQVHAGDTIGLVGSTGFSTGPHLHFGVKVNGAWVDPEPLIGQGGSAPAQDEVESTPHSGFVIKAKVNTPDDVLNVRSGPGTTYPKVGYLNNGDLVTVQDLASEEIWVQIGDGRFVAMRFNGSWYLEPA